MTTNVESTNVCAASGARQKLKLAGAIATIVIAMWATAVPASANSFGSRPTANKTASMIHRLRVASLAPASCWYGLPLILGVGF